ncbi:pentatricopeptide repeat-containing protein At5g39350-like [Primulina eburnea]|uniref:pentatricopeptide repeat-containing protein At5g39350-like n=1 Tax=Primulina eburnea TaxID=1245227 RepID=UPI003C6C7810
MANLTGSSLRSHFLYNSSNFATIVLSLFPCCQKRQDFRALNALLIVNGLIEHQSLIKQFITKCCHLGFPDLALSAFKTIEKPSLSLQNLFLRSLCDNGLFGNVLSVYEMGRISGSLSDNYTYPFVIKACSALSDTGRGESMHCLVTRDGFGENLVVQTSLVDFYSKGGEMDNARKLVDEISQPDVVTWNALISGFSFNSFDDEVFRVFHEMRYMAMRPNTSTFASLFRVCSKLVAFDFGKSLHGLAYKLGYAMRESLVPALISTYANCQDMLAARNIFDTSTFKNVVVWNAIISAYTRNNKPEDAIALFQRMLLDDIKPDVVTFVSLIPSSENLGCVCYVESLHAYAMKFGFTKQLSVVTALLSVYGKLGNIYSAELLFCNVNQRNLLSWNSMVSAYASNGLWKHSLTAFHDMQMDGCKPDAISIISILTVCSKLEAILLGKSAHAFSVRMGIDSNLNVCNSLMGFYIECRELAVSFSIFDRMALKSVVSWNTMISGCVDKGEPERSLLLLHHMRLQGVEFDLVSLISILSYCNEFQNLILGSAIHNYAIRTGFADDISLANSLVTMYINCGQLGAGRLLFNDMPNKSVVSWNAILTGYRYHNSPKETLESFIHMIKKGHRPNYVTLLNVLPACCTNLEGKSIHAYILRLQIPLETNLLTSLIIMYGKFGIFASCLALFHEGEKGSISSWNTVLSAYLLSKNARGAVAFFRDLLRNNIEPDNVTILNLISACRHLQNLHISNSILAFVVQKGFDKDVAISNALIDLFGKCGSIPSAKKLFDLLPQKDTKSWNIMINVYGLNGDGESALSLYSQMRLLGLKLDKVTYMGILSACSHSGLVQQGRMVFNCMIQDGVLPCMEHYACILDLLGRKGYLKEARDIVQNLLCKPSESVFKSLLGACLSHGNYELGEEFGRLLLETNLKDPGAYVILHNIYAASGKWLDADNVRLTMEQNQFHKPLGFSLIDVNAGILDVQS